VAFGRPWCALLALRDAQSLDARRLMGCLLTPMLPILSDQDWLSIIKRTAKHKAKIDWSRVDAMTEAERHAAAMADPDARPMTDEEWAQAPRVPVVSIVRRALKLSQEQFAAAFRIPDWNDPGLGAGLPFAGDDTQFDATAPHRRRGTPWRNSQGQEPRHRKPPNRRADRRSIPPRCSRRSGGSPRSPAATPAAPSS
jgi:hypothetical protein